MEGPNSSLYAKKSAKLPKVQYCITGLRKWVTELTLTLVKFDGSDHSSTLWTPRDKGRVLKGSKSSHELLHQRAIDRVTKTQCQVYI